MLRDSGYCGKRLCVKVPRVKGLQTGCGAVGFPGTESSDERVGLGRQFSISLGERIDDWAGFGLILEELGEIVRY